MKNAIPLLAINQATPRKISILRVGPRQQMIGALLGCLFGQNTPTGRGQWSSRMKLRLEFRTHASRLMQYIFLRGSAHTISCFVLFLQSVRGSRRVLLFYHEHIRVYTPAPDIKHAAERKYCCSAACANCIKILAHLHFAFSFSCVSKNFMFYFLFFNFFSIE
jgi:hypothetical protein